MFSLLRSLFRKKKVINRNKLNPSTMATMGFFEKITFMVTTAPDSQVDQCVVDEAISLLKKKASEREYYLWLDKTYSDSCCATSSFIKALVNVRAHYAEPAA